jgi:hypothetical protein
MIRRIAGVLTVGALIGFAAQAHAQEETPPPPTPTLATSAAEIVRPAENETVQGVITLVGTAVDPAFQSYVLEIAPDPSARDFDWPNLQSPVTQQVRDGVIGQWDTSGVPDGRYFIRLVMTVGEGADQTLIVSDEVRVTVANSTATPLPLQATSTITAVPGTLTPGPSPTSLIEMPPTRTPRPTSTPGGPTDTPEPAPLSAPDSPLRPERLRQAAWNGVKIALAIFGLLAAYAIGRAAVRGTLRAGWRSFKSDIWNPLIEGLRRK